MSGKETVRAKGRWCGRWTEEGGVTGGAEDQSVMGRTAPLHRRPVGEHVSGTSHEMNLLSDMEHLHTVFLCLCVLGGVCV